MGSLISSTEWDELPCGLLTLSDSGQIVSANAHLQHMLGLGESALMGAHVDDMLPPASRQMYHSYLVPLLKQQGHIDEIALPLKCADGLYLDTMFNACRSGASDQARVHCAFFPLKEQRRLESQLLHAKRAAEQIPGVLFHLRHETDGELRFHYASEGLRALFGVSPREAAASANHVLAKVHSEDIQAVLSSLQHSANLLTPWRVEYRVDLPTGMQWRETYASPQLDSDGGVSWHGYILDITERKALEAVRRDKAAAEHASRAKSEFLARISHELRTPLNGILGFAQLLLMDSRATLDEGQRRRVACIETSGQTLLSLINEVMDIARIESGGVHMSIDEVDLAPVLMEAVTIVETMAAQRQVVMDVDVTGGHRVRADVQRLRQVVINLLSNAIKYGPSGGVVRMRACLEPPWLRIVVSDQGPGLTPEQQAQLFQPFNRLGAERTSTEGHGLGLVITRNLVQLMGGRILVNSVPGQGACFGVLLPQAASSAAQAISGTMSS